MKRKFFIFVLSIWIVFGFTSCSWFDVPADARRIGCGYIQYDRGIYFVEIDSVKYNPSRVYANSSSRDGKNMMDPVDGMMVTCFTLQGNDKVEFIAGDLSEEYLEKYFWKNYTMAAIFGLLLLVCVILACIPDGKRKVVYAD